MLCDNNAVQENYENLIFICQICCSARIGPFLLCFYLQNVISSFSLIFEKCFLSNAVWFCFQINFLTISINSTLSFALLSVVQLPVIPMAFKVTYFHSFKRSILSSGLSFQPFYYAPRHSSLCPSTSLNLASRALNFDDIHTSYSKF